LEVDSDRDQNEAENEEAGQKQEEDEADVRIRRSPVTEYVHHPETNQDKGGRGGDGPTDKAENIPAQKEEGLKPILLETAGFGHEGRLVTEFVLLSGPGWWWFPRHYRVRIRGKLGLFPEICAH
jgi:hypothetical protein